MRRKIENYMFERLVITSVRVIIPLSPGTQELIRPFVKQ